MGPIGAARCLNLYSNDVLSKSELLLLVEDVLGTHADFFDIFRHFLGVSESVRCLSAAAQRLSRLWQRAGSIPRCTMRAERDIIRCQALLL